MKRLKSVLLLGVVLSLISGVSSGEAAKYQWKFGSPFTMPHLNPYFEKFCERVKEYTNGQVEIRYYPDGQLGTHDEIFHSVQDGSLEIGQISPHDHLVPGGKVGWIPWTISTWDEFRELYKPGEGALWKLMPVVYEEVGIHPLYYRSYGAYGIGNRTRPIRTPEDFKGLKFRVSGSQSYVRVLENMCKGTGASFETLPFAELYNALSKGVVDACWAHWPQLLVDRHGEVLKYYTDLRWGWDMTNIIMNKELWDTLPEDIKQSISKAAAESQVEFMDFEEREEVNIINRIKTQMTNLVIVELTDEERDAFRLKANTLEIWEEMSKPWLDKHFPGQEMAKKLLEESNRVRDELRAKQKK